MQPIYVCVLSHYQPKRLRSEKRWGTSLAIFAGYGNFRLVGPISDDL